MLIGDKALMTIFKDDVSKVAVCYHCHSIRGYFKGEWPKGMWVSVLYKDEPCHQCGKYEQSMLLRNNGCIALVAEW